MASSFQATSVFAITNLTRLKDELSKYKELIGLQLDIDDAIGRFSVWAMNIGAIQHASLRKSLDYRLRDAPEIRDQLLSVFDRLCVAAEIALRIMTTESRNRRDDEHIRLEEQGNGEGREADMDLASELNELFLSIKSSIDTLFRLSMLLRRHRPKGRLPCSPSNDDGGPPPSDPTDMTHICDLFPSVKEKPWLVRRLAEAMSRRRGYIKYRERHRSSLAVVEEMEQIGNGDEPETIGTIATTFVDLEQVESQPRSEVRTALTSATSFISTINDDNNDEGPGTAIPDLRQMRMYGRDLCYGEPFECPLCRTIQCVAERQEWKGHVFADLEPYVCTFEVCPSSSSLFSSRQEWWQHEVDNHRRGWKCAICATTQAGTESLSLDFTSKGDIEAHIRKIHSDSVTDIQVEFVVKMCESPVSVDSSSCPFCTDWAAESKEKEENEINLKGFAKHLARHMQRLALASIPIHIEGLEVLDVRRYGESAGGISAGISLTEDVSRELLSGENDSILGTVADEMVRSSFLDAALAGVTAFRLTRTGRVTDEGTSLDSKGTDGKVKSNTDIAKVLERFTLGRDGVRQPPVVDDLVALAKHSWERANPSGKKRGD